MRTGKAFRCAVLVLPVFLLLVSAAPAPPPMSPHEKAAREVVKLVGGPDLAMQGVTMMFDMYGKEAEPNPYLDQLQGWFRQVLAGSDLQEQMVRFYMDAFSEKELLEIAAFYKTPAGRKVVETTPKLMKWGFDFGVKQLQAHSAELTEMEVRAQEEPAATDAGAQKRTVADIRNVGTAMFSWLTDQVGAAAAGQSQTEYVAPPIDLKDYPPISHEELTKLLVPDYIMKIPEKDGWGNSYEYFLNASNPLAQQVMTIRSPGRDGKYSERIYTVTSFDPDDVDEDIVWADGYFIRWPQRQEQKEE